MNSLLWIWCVDLPGSLAYHLCADVVPTRLVNLASRFTVPGLYVVASNYCQVVRPGNQQLSRFPDMLQRTPSYCITGTPSSASSSSSRIHCSLTTYNMLPEGSTTQLGNGAMVNG